MSRCSCRCSRIPSGAAWPFVTASCISFAYQYRWQGITLKSLILKPFYSMLRDHLGRDLLCRDSLNRSSMSRGKNTSLSGHTHHSLSHNLGHRASKSLNKERNHTVITDLASKRMHEGKNNPPLTERGSERKTAGQSKLEISGLRFDVTKMNVIHRRGGKVGNVGGNEKKRRSSNEWSKGDRPKSFKKPLSHKVKTQENDFLVKNTLFCLEISNVSNPIGLQEKGYYTERPQTNNQKHERTTFRVGQMITQPLCRSPLTYTPNSQPRAIEALRKAYMVPFHLQISKLMNESKVKGTIHQDKLELPLKFNDVPRLEASRLEVSREQTSKRELRLKTEMSPPGHKYSYSKIYDQEMTTRNKKVFTNLSLL